MACVSFPGECAKGKGKSLFSTQDPLFELFLERQFVKDWPSLPPRDSRGQCSLNLQEEGETAAGLPACSAQFTPKAQSLELLPSCPEGQKRGEDTGRGSRARLSLGAAMFVRKLQLKEQKRGKFPSHFFIPF